MTNEEREAAAASRGAARAALLEKISRKKFKRERASAEEDRMNTPCEVHESDLRRYRAERDAAVHEREALKAHLLVEHEKLAQLQRQCARLERERDELAAQLAALRAEVRGPLALFDADSDEDPSRDDVHSALLMLRDALADTAPAAEAHTRRVQAEALESAAEAFALARREHRDVQHADSWLRARAAEIRGGR